MIKALPFCFLFLFIQQSASSQQLPWDSTYRPDIYQTRVDLHASFPKSSDDIVFLGNSIVFWADWNELTGIPTIKNRGIPGDITFGALERLADITAGKPAKIFILIGINDLARKIPVPVILENYKKMIARIQEESPSTQIYFHTLLPTNERFKKLNSHYHHEQEIQRINQELERVTRNSDVKLIDLYGAFADKDGRLKEAYTWDGVHLTLKGYRKWAELVYSEIAARNASEK